MGGLPVIAWLRLPRASDLHPTRAGYRWGGRHDEVAPRRMPLAVHT
jgi:hypothetical protein